jgi:hypothetical protein
MFWGVALGLTDKKEVKVEYDERDKPLEHKEETLMGKVSGVIGKILDCCRE